MTLKAIGNLAAPLLWVLCTTLTTPALASLGGNADTVSADTHMLKGTLATSSLLQYDVQQISTGTLLINEYVTRSGQVFAVTWQGPTPPNLQQLLGAYFPRFQAAATAAHQTNPGIHRQLTISQSDLVVQASGRLRSFHGIAYLPALVPDGVSLSDLR
jgi:hypothetical protein